MSCKRCGNKGYTIGIAPGGRTAMARACDCKGSCSICGGVGALWGRTDRPGVWYSSDDWVLGGHEYEPRIPPGHYRHVRDCDCKTTGVDITRHIELFNDAGIPAGYRHATFYTYVPQVPHAQGQQAAKDALQSKVTAATLGTAPGLILHGVVGVGKTHLAIAAIRALTLTHGTAAVFVDFGALLSELKTLFGTQGLSGKLLERIEDAPILVLDEVGRHVTRKYGREVIEQIITARYNSGRPMWITSNFTAAELSGQDKLGDRIGSRLAEACAWTITVPGDNYREKGQAGQRSMM